MSMAALIPVVLQASIVLSVFGLGLNASSQHATYLFRRRSQLVRSLLSMYVVVPLFAVALVAAFALHPGVKIALVALAVSPVPPVLPRKALKAGGEEAYTIGLLVATALLAIVFIPLAMEVLESVFAVPLQMSAAALARLILITVLAPLAAGMIVRHLAPALAQQIAYPVALLATALLVAGGLPIVFTAWPAVVSLIGNGTLAAIAVFVLVGLAAGHLLGGPNPQDRTVLALSTASRHPGVALAIAGANFPEQKLVLAAVLLYLIVNAIVALPYLAWLRNQHAGIAGTS